MQALRYFELFLLWFTFSKKFSTKKVVWIWAPLQGRKFDVLRWLLVNRISVLSLTSALVPFIANPFLQV